MISSISKPKIVHSEGNKALFEIEGLYPGYGTTIGNSLRRVLLSSLEGAAVTRIKIKGVQHEFSTKSGVLEDIISVILNVKKLRFKTFSDEPQTVTLKVKGEREVKASDLEVPTQLELVNKELHIATLTDAKASLEMELTVEKGFGFVIAEQEQREKLEVGQISIDSIFTPIRGVNFKVENMRVGKRTDFDRLFIEIETDGTIEPMEALKNAAKILVDHFVILTGEEEVDVSKTKIEETGLSSRTANLLIKAGIKTLGGLTRKSREALSEIDGMGKKGIEEIEEEVKKFGVELK